MAFKIKLKPSAGASAGAGAGAGASAGGGGGGALLAPPKVRLKLAPLGVRGGEGAPAAAAGGVADAGGEALAVPRITIKQGGLKLLLKPGKVAKRAVPRIRVKPTRIPGEGFDSEAPDREDDPLIEDAVIVRFTDEVAAKEPAAFAFLDKALESGDMLGVSVKWRDARRAVVMVHGVLFGGKLLDLPTVVEIHKLLDRKTLFKNMDVCQVLLVTDVLLKEDDISDPTLRFNVYRHDYYPHGITPPMRQARRRFRKRVLNKVIELVENQVEQLLMADEEALELPDYELVDPHAALAAATPYEEEDEEEPLVEGATPAAGDEAEEIDDNALEAELEEALAEEGGDEDDEGGDEDDDGEDEDEDDEDDEDEDLSPEAVQLRQEKTRLKQEIRDMEQTVTRKQEQLRHGLVVVGHNANSELHKVQELLEAKRMQLALVEDRAAQPDNKGVLQAVGEEEEEEDDDDDDDMDDLF